MTVTGRPNAGKSSLLRNVLRRDVLDRFKITVGKRPGTTKRINQLSVLGGELTIIDFPGWGHLSSRSRKEKDQLLDAMATFFEKNGKKVILALHVIDIRTFRDVSLRLEKKGFIPIDLEMVQFLEEVMAKKSFIAIVLTKIDKFSDKEMLERELKLAREHLPSHIPIFPLSNKDKTGMYELQGTFLRYLRKYFSKEKLRDVFVFPSSR